MLRFLVFHPGSDDFQVVEGVSAAAYSIRKNPGYFVAFNVNDYNDNLQTERMKLSAKGGNWLQLF